MQITVASRESGLTKRRLFALISTGELPSVKVGRQRLIMREDLERFLAEHRQPAAS
jgi:excisionase family DNA binding protein